MALFGRNTGLIQRVYSVELVLWAVQGSVTTTLIRRIQMDKMAPADSANQSEAFMG